MKRLLLIGFLLAALYVQAQHKVNFSSQNYAGLLRGQSGSTLQLQTINGIRFDQWFAGLGTGIDWYSRRSLPLFLSLNRDFFNRARTNFYLAADGGFNFPWKNDKNYNEPGFSVEKAQGGIYCGGGLGYRIGVGKKTNAVLIQLGYRYKHIRTIVQNYNYYLDTRVLTIIQPAITNRLDYHLQSLSLKAGWSF